MARKPTIEDAQEMWALCQRYRDFQTVMGGHNDYETLPVMPLTKMIAEAGGFKAAGIDRTEVNDLLAEVRIATAQECLESCKKKAQEGELLKEDVVGTEEPCYSSSTGYLGFGLKSLVEAAGGPTAIGSSDTEIRILEAVSHIGNSTIKHPASGFSRKQQETYQRMMQNPAAYQGGNPGTPSNPTGFIQERSPSKRPKILRNAGPMI